MMERIEGCVVNELSGNKIGDKGAKAISKMLKVNTTLTSLDLRSRKEEKEKDE